MPSLCSISISSPLDSSTSMTPSLPTSLRASAILLPTSSLCALMVATLTQSLSLTSVLAFLSSVTTAWTARSIPRFMNIGLVPVVTLFIPALTSSFASKVAVVVPSPAASLVLLAASLTSWAPMFSNLSSSSISLATLTPSWTMLGAPHLLSSATLRPRGPRVVTTASASWLTPDNSFWRASSPNASCLAVIYRFLLWRNT